MREREDRDPIANVHVSRTIDTSIGVSNGIILVTLGVIVFDLLLNKTLALCVISTGILWDLYSGLNYMTMYFYPEGKKYKKNTVVKVLAFLRIILNILTFSVYIYVLVVVAESSRA